MYGVPRPATINRSASPPAPPMRVRRSGAACSAHRWRPSGARTSFRGPRRDLVALAPRCSFSAITLGSKSSSDSFSPTCACRPITLTVNATISSCPVGARLKSGRYNTQLRRGVRLALRRCRMAPWFSHLLDVAFAEPYFGTSSMSIPSFFS